MNLHILGVQAYAGDVPRMTVLHEGRVREWPLVGPFDWQVDAGRTCIGAWDRDGHQACPVAAPVGGDLQCPRCCPLEEPACVFEPRCRDDPTGCTCTTSFRNVPHVVYLAFYGTLPKVGMTSRRRFGTRLREQGADAAFIVAGHETDLGRGEARRVEQEVAYLHNVPEHRKAREVLAQVARPLPREAVEARVERWQARLASYAPGPVSWFDDYPWTPLGQRPYLEQAEGRHRGTWSGGKGRHVYYRAARLGLGGHPVAALRASDLIARRVDVRPAEATEEAATQAPAHRDQAPR